MNVFILVFVTGMLAVQYWARLPNPLEWLLMISLTSGLVYRRLPVLWVFLLGMAWAAIYGQYRLTDRLADPLEGEDVMVQGYVANFPRSLDNRVGFDFVVSPSIEGVPSTIRLNWYTPPIAIKAGQAWQMPVRLKKPHGRINPGGFDYEAWLFANHIGATGYVRSKPQSQQIKGGFSAHRYLVKVRQLISDHLDAALPGSQQLGIIKALSIGSQELISQQQWQVFRITGVVHLMVISGSHISLVAGLVFLWVRRAWAGSGVLTVSPQTVAAYAAWLAGLFYAAVAGFSLPVQRAVLMLTVWLWAIVRQRHTASMQVLLLALLVVVLFDPLALLAAGFWLSFAAVALLLFMSGNRLGKQRYWYQIGKLHLAMAIGLGPLLIVFFQQMSLVAPLANYLAVPLVGVLITPLSLLAALVAFISPGFAALLLWPVEYLLKMLWWLLLQMADWPLASLSSLHAPWYNVLFAGLGVLLLLLPKGFQGRYLSVFFILPVFFNTVKTPAAGEVWFSLLDVGQGLAAVVQTQQHTLVFDTGVKYAEQADMGESVILPYLHYQGISHIDTLVISHGDIDHSGGAESLLSDMPVTKLYSSVAAWAERPAGSYCRAGQSWQWDGVDFSMLSPDLDGFHSENDNSCVLRISNKRHSFLLTGDIQQAAEKHLVAQYADGLISEVLVAPHHGSKTSSSPAFLEQVKPKTVLIPAGYRNRFGFPHQSVIQRYQRMQANIYSSANDGAISFKTDGADMRLALMRQQQRKYWME
jgi:competence protein ComEC